MKNLMLYALALMVGMFAGPGLAEAQRYPTRPVRIIIPFPPGEAADIIARLIQPVITASSCAASAWPTSCDEIRVAGYE